MKARARDAMRGSPSPWKVFKRTARDAPERVMRVSVSDRESSFEVVEGMMAGRGVCSGG